MSSATTFLKCHYVVARASTATLCHLRRRKSAAPKQFLPLLNKAQFAVNMMFHIYERQIISVIFITINAYPCISACDDSTV